MAKFLTLLQNWNYQLNDLKCIILQVQNQYKVKQSLFSTVASLWIRTRKALVAFQINQQNKRSNAKQLSPTWIITLEYSESLSFNRRSKILHWTHLLKDVHPRVIQANELVVLCSAYDHSVYNMIYRSLLWISPWIWLAILPLSICCYIVTQVILAFWLVLAYDLLEHRRIDDDSARFQFFLIFFNFEFEPIKILW